MTMSADSPHRVQQRDPGLTEIVEHAIGRLLTGESVDIEALAADHPPHAEEIRDLVPAARELMQWCESPGAPQSWPSLITAGVDEAIDRRLGDFRIVRELGRGGMGTVYEAEQLSMGRRVALKVLSFAALAQTKAVERFRNEVRAAAALDHPHIVSVYSVGEERGVHFYAMQLIRGQSLAAMIEAIRVDRRLAESADDGVPTAKQRTTATTQPIAHAQVSTAPDRRSDAERFRAVARLGIQAAQALQHAHDVGVLHRDIKPGNIMLDHDGELFITDFGLARIQSDVGLTMTGDVIGTLRYMAPEQALANRVVVDHRADIYSLGATLYELLTLQPAFGETDRSELLKRIAFDEPLAPRGIDRAIPADLETIVLKAMAKQADERYASAAQLADDLTAFLDHRPILASRPSLVDRARRWSRRHPAFVRSALALMAVTTLGSVIGATAIWRANGRTADALFKSKEHLKQAQAQRLAAEQSAAESAAVLEFLTSDIIGAASADRDQRRDLTVKGALEAAAKHCGAAFVHQPSVEVAIRIAISRSYQTLADFDAAREQLELAYHRASRELGPESVEALTAEYFLARLTNLEGNLPLARVELEQVLATVVRRLGPTHPLVARARYQLGNNARRQHRPDEAVEQLSFAMEVWSRDPSMQGEPLLGVMGDLAMALWVRGDIGAAEELAQARLRRARQLYPPNDLQIIKAERSLVRIPSPQRTDEQIRVVRERAVAAYRLAYGDDHYKTREAMRELARTYEALGLEDDAQELLAEAEQP